MNELAFASVADEFARPLPATLVLVLPSILVLTACASGEAPAVRALVRDSVGIIIVENTAPLATDSIAFRIDSVPAVEIGGSGDPREEFGRVVGVLRLPDGGIAVADGNNQELKVFDSAGTWRRLVGGKGGGPGEFEQLGGLYRLGGDSLAVHDGNHRRLSVFTAQGDLIREMSLSQEGVGAGILNVLGVLADGELLVMQDRFSPEAAQSGPQRDSIDVLRYTREAVLADSIGRFAGPELYREVETSEGRLRGVVSMGLPFGLMPTMVAADDGLYVGSGERYEIAQYDRGGRLTRLIRRTHTPAAVTAADIATMRAHRLERLRPGMEALRDRLNRLFERMTFPDTKPAYDGFVAGDDGALWVRRYDQPVVDLPARYDVFDRDGQWLGHVTFPSRFTLHHAGPGYALGVWQDPDELEHVRLYRLTSVP